jgi:alpha-D-ribose 1-methylphosphonate 5-triphosphate diphosphatase
LDEQVCARRDAVPAAVARLAEAARKAVIPMASHDDDSSALRRRYRALGCQICEFPFDDATARAAIEAGETVILGGPNVVRGGSHGTRLSATEAAEAGLFGALTSDYYYPPASGLYPGRSWHLALRRVLGAGLAQPGARRWPR